MRTEPDATDVTRFGPYEWDPARAELRRRGVRVRLAGQPLEVLTILLERADHLVTREELRQQLWGDRAYVDFEQGLNTAIARLRQALRDSAEQPRYIETVTGRGYRFVGALDPRAEDTGPGPASSALLDRRVWLAGGIGLALGAGGAYWSSWLPRPAAPRPAPRRFAVSGPPDPDFASSVLHRDLAIASDGRRIAYLTTTDGASRIYVRELERTEGRFLPGSDVYSPFFSPDGTEVGYLQFTSHSLLRASIAGGPATRITDVPTFLAGASWGPNGQIVFGTLESTTGLERVPALGGPSETLTTPEPGFGHALPHVLPGGRAVLFTIFPVEAPEASNVALLDLATAAVRTLVPGSHPTYSPTGHLLFVRNGNLMAAPFDERALEVTGPEATVLTGLAASSGETATAAQYALANDGSLLLATDAADLDRRIVWVDRDGNEEPLPAPPRGYTYPRVSPDGSRVALNMRDARGGGIDLWDVTRAASTPFTEGRETVVYPVWSRDGTRVAYQAAGSAERHVFVKTVGTGGTGRVVEAAREPELRALYAFSPAGDALVFARQGPEGADLWTMPVDIPAEPALLMRRARNADLAPDGMWIAYQSDASGRFEIYVRSYPNVDERYVQLSVDGGVQPVWSPRGDELFFVEPGPPARLMAVDVDPDRRPRFSRPRPLLDWPYFTSALGRTYDVSRPDGRRFIAIRDQASDRQSSRIELIVDWAATLAAAVERI